MAARACACLRRLWWDNALRTKPNAAQASLLADVGGTLNDPSNSPCFATFASVLWLEHKDEFDDAPELGDLVKAATLAWDEVTAIPPSAPSGGGNAQPAAAASGAPVTPLGSTSAAFAAPAAALAAPARPGAKGSAVGFTLGDGKRRRGASTAAQGPNAARQAPPDPLRQPTGSAPPGAAAPVAPAPASAAAAAAARTAEPATAPAAPAAPSTPAAPAPAGAEELPDAWSLVHAMYGEAGLQEIRQELERVHGVELAATVNMGQHRLQGQHAQQQLRRG